MYYISKHRHQLTRAHSDDAGFDLRCASEKEFIIKPGSTVMVETGIHARLNPGTVGLVCSRSGLAAKYSVFVINSPGIVDSGYRGEFKILLHNAGLANFLVKPGDRIAQLVIVAYSREPAYLLEGHTSEQALIDMDKEWGPASRGTSGFGSTGVE